MRSNAPEKDVQHFTVVFRIPGPREATGKFLTDLSARFSDQQPEIVAIQAGNVLETLDRAESTAAKTYSNKNRRTL